MKLGVERLRCADMVFDLIKRRNSNLGRGIGRGNRSHESEKGWVSRMCLLFQCWVLHKGFDPAVNIRKATECLSKLLI